MKVFRTDQTSGRQYKSGGQFAEGSPHSALSITRDTIQLDEREPNGKAFQGRESSNQT